MFWHHIIYLYIHNFSPRSPACILRLKPFWKTQVLWTPIAWETKGHRHHGCIRADATATPPSSARGFLLSPCACAHACTPAYTCQCTRVARPGLSAAECPGPPHARLRREAGSGPAPLPRLVPCQRPLGAAPARALHPGTSAGTAGNPAPAAGPCWAPLALQTLTGCFWPSMATGTSPTARPCPAQCGAVARPLLAASPRMERASGGENRCL